MSTGFNRGQLTPEQMHTLNSAYIQIRVQGGEVWKRRYKALTRLPTELLDELEREIDAGH